MFENEEKIKIYATTFNAVVKNLSTIKDCPLEEFQDLVEEKFDGYNYEGEEEVVGFENWGDISANGEYKLIVKVDHEDAYEITLHTIVKDGKATVTNVL